MIAVEPTRDAGQLRVTHLLWGLEMGGIQRSLLSLARRGASLGLRSMVIAFHEGAAGPLLEQAGCEVVLVPKSPGFDRGLTLRLAAALERGRPGVLHCHDFSACFWGNRAADGVGLAAPRVATLHSWMFGLSWPKRRLYLRELARMDRVIAISEATRSRLLAHGISARSLETLPPGPEPADGPPVSREAARRELGIPSGTLAALCCARLEAEKNLPLLVELAERLRDSPIPVRFLVAGEGSRRARLERLILQRGASDSVRLLGLRGDVFLLLAAADVFVLPSRSEELPLALLEAMAAGLPVLATPVGALPDLVPGPPPAGFLVPARDAAGWARRLRDLAGDRELRLALGAAGRLRAAERFDAGRNAAALASLYRRLAEPGS